MPHRRWFLIAAAVGLLGHAAALAAFGERPPGPLISDLIQFSLGVGATWAAGEAAIRSGAYARKVWTLTALALAIYTAGQGIVVYYNQVLHAPLFSPWISDQFLFFWIVPLGMAVLIDRWSNKGRLDWALALDFSQAFLVALALHTSIFALSTSWQREGRDLAFLEWQIRMMRDGVVLAALASKVLLSRNERTRSLFTRLGGFFFAYTVADGVYLYAEAAWQTTVGGWLDLLWTAPRVALILVAVTWTDLPDDAVLAPPPRTRRQILPLHFAPILGPLLCGLIALRMAGEAPKLAATLIALSFTASSIRFLITQDRQESATAELRSSHDLFEAVVEGIAEAVYVRDLEGRYVLANRAGRTFIGSPDVDLVGRTDFEFFSPQSAQHIRETDQQVIRSGKTLAVEETLDLSGRSRIFLTRKGPYRDAKGDLAGVLGIAVDVTEQRKMEEEIRKAQRMESIGTLAGGVAHDFNNMLTVIKGYSQMLLEEGAPTAGLPELKQIDAAADKAAALTRQLLAFSRQQLMQPKVISLNHIIHDMEKMLRRLIGADIEFTVRPTEPLGSVRADPGQIEQVIMNLAVNARDAMPRGGKLTIETANIQLDEKYSEEHLQAPPGAYVLMAVSDTGMGMDKKTQARVFEPFFTTKAPGKGTGLGLSTAYGIIKQSGGYIWVYSEVGHGTTFKIYLPVVDALPDSVPAEAKGLPHKAGTETILVVEDDATLASLVVTSLKRKGYRVLVAGTGDEAEAAARHLDGTLHLLLTDVVMPRTNGREVAEKVCRLKPEARVLWMSGYTDDTIVHHGMLEPGIHFLQKPFTPATLVDKVREVLDLP